ncbi:MAG: helix-turn-helix transcriptional regulator [Balneolaceae bacterium]|nr:helix-turn-helix transcriptional regulator [Balneolaceae bacterium]
MSDMALIQQIGSYIKHHRLQQNRTQHEVAKAAGISRSTLSLLERGEAVTLLTFIQIIRVLDLLHLMDAFEVSQRPSPIELAKQERRKRQRARHVGKNDNSAGEEA